ncbi:MAG: NADH-quinone oxidoreductase subunit I [Deltaproteobacteria bacterium]|nr:NADH-quinone oxidoreductase subunit I [Deltaproteobacteria bacterium]
MNEGKGRFDIMELIKKVLFTDFVKGLVITFGYNVSMDSVITVKYPDEEKWIPYRRFRGLHTLNRTADGRELCVACELCSKACPTRCITVIPMEDNTGRGISDRVAKVWKVDLVRCLFCGYCEDACPTRAVRLGREYELACFDRNCAVKNREELLRPQPVPEEMSGGVVAKARLRTTPDGIEVVADLSETRKRRV